MKVEEVIECNKPTAIFWDIENVNKPESELQKFIDSIRSDLIDKNQLYEVQFVAVYSEDTSIDSIPNDAKLSILEKNSIKCESVERNPEAADLRIIDLIGEFVATYKDRSTIILISGDGDFTKRLLQHKDAHKITIITVHRPKGFSHYLDAVADETYTVSEDGLSSITERLNVNAVKVTGFPSNVDKNIIKSELVEIFGYVGGSKDAIYFDCDAHCYWINFECSRMASLVTETKNGVNCSGSSLALEYVDNPPDNVVQRLYQLDLDHSVRQKKLLIIRTAYRYQYERSWREAKQPITPLKTKDSEKKRQSLFYCIYVSGFPLNIDKSTAETFFNKYFNTEVKMFWESDHSIAIQVMNKRRTAQFIEDVNRSNIHPAWKLKATLFYVFDYPDDIKEAKLSKDWYFYFYWPSLLRMEPIHGILHEERREILAPAAGSAIEVNTTEPESK